MSRYEAWINKLSLPALLATIAVGIVAMAGLNALSWYLAHWLSLWIWIPATTVGTLIRPVWKAVRK